MSRVRFRGRDRVRSMFWTIMLIQEHILPLFTGCYRWGPGLMEMMLGYHNNLIRSHTLGGRDDNLIETFVFIGLPLRSERPAHGLKQKLDRSHTAAHMKHSQSDGKTRVTHTIWPIKHVCVCVCVCVLLWLTTAQHSHFSCKLTKELKCINVKHNLLLGLGVIAEIMIFFSLLMRYTSIFVFLLTCFHWNSFKEWFLSIRGASHPS